MNNTNFYPPIMNQDLKQLSNNLQEKIQFRQIQKIAVAILLIIIF